MKTLLVKSAEVLATMDVAGREIKGGDVYIEGPEIKKVGKGLKVKADGLNSDLHASAEYRAHLITVMAKRAVEAALK